MSEKLKECCLEHANWWMEQARYWAEASKDKKLNYETRLRYWQYSLQAECRAEKWLALIK